MTQTSNDTIDRREALRRAGLLLGGVLTPATVTGVLAGCEARRTPNGAWSPKVLSADEVESVATMAEHILPETDTPGARAVGVHRFIDALLAESFPVAERQRFVAGLADVDARARRTCGRAFLECTPGEQRALLEQLDGETFAASTPDDAMPFFRVLKELTLLGYYTSEAGATRELRHNPVPGRFEGCVPLAQVGRAWAV
jgi:gluconate 2-dehydrogenase gamma chain